VPAEKKKEKKGENGGGLRLLTDWMASVVPRDAVDEKGATQRDGKRPSRRGKKGVWSGAGCGGAALLREKGTSVSDEGGGKGKAITHYLHLPRPERAPGCAAGGDDGGEKKEEEVVL